MRIADTSALYPLFDDDDQHHEAARGAFEMNAPLRIPREILVETINLIEYRFGTDPAHTALDHLLSPPHISIADAVPLDGIQEAYQEAHGELSLADAVVVQTCRVHGAKPLSYDDAINRRIS